MDILIAISEKHLHYSLFVRRIIAIESTTLLFGLSRTINATLCNVKSVQSALSDLLITSATHGTFSRPSTKRGLISIIKLMQFTIVRFF